MQIVKIESWNRDFFCPVTGLNMEDCVLGNNAVNSFRGLWVNGFYDVPTLKCEALEEAWEARYKKYRKDEEDVREGEVLETFLQEYEQPNWVAFELTTHGIACGPVCETVWYVLDLGTIKEKVEEPRPSVAGKSM